MRLLKNSLLTVLLATVSACVSTTTDDPVRTGTEYSPCAATGACADSNPAKTEDAGAALRPPALFQWSGAAAQWVQTNWAEGNTYFNLYASQDWVFARTWDAMNGGRTFLTTDTGTSWTLIGSADSELDTSSVLRMSSNILASTWDGFYLSTSTGASWTPLTPAGVPANTAIKSIVAIDSALFAGSTGHVYKSLDNGTTWTDLAGGLPTGAVISSIVANANGLYAGSDGNGVFARPNGGSSWSAVNSGLTDTHVAQLVASGTRLLAVTLGGVFVSANNGATWTADSSGIAKVDCFLSANGLLFAGTDGSGVQLSVDDGLSWTAYNTGLPNGTRVWSLAASNDNLFAGTDSGIWRTPSVANIAPTVVSAAAANPNPVTGAATNLSVLGDDDAGEANIRYTWATVGPAPAGVTFGTNGNNTAKSTTATFTQAGSYTLQVTLTDQGGLTATSTVVVTVNQTLTSIVLAPTSSTIQPLATQQFVATARDQFANPLTSPPTLSWTVSGGGSIAGNGLFTAGSSTGGPYTVTATGGGVSGTATIAVAIPNVGPSISAPAAANANPVTGKTTSLSVLGSDDAGEANLTYTWMVTGTPPATVALSANGTNAAKNIIATFSKAGSYTLQVTVADQEGLTATSSVTVTVQQTLTGISVSPASATVNTSASLQFGASAQDQFGTTLAPQPTFTWTTSGGGSIGASGLFVAGSTAGGPYAVTATSGAVSGSASVTVVALPSTKYQINTGSSSAASPFIADQSFSGGTKRTVSNSITISGITNPAPMAVYQSERYGTSTYTLPDLTLGSQYTVRLHFAELYWTATGKRKFNVVINGTTVLSSFDIYAAAGAAYKAVVREFTATPNPSGQIVINFKTVTDNASIEGIEIIALTPNYPPNVVTPASATPNPVTGTTAALSVLGSDDGGESNLTYTWSTSGPAPAGVAFAANGSNAAKNTTATFTKAGNYTLQVTLADTAGLTATSTVPVTVDQTLTSIALSPTSVTLQPLATQQFVATARDQFGAALASMPAVAWAVNGSGAIDGNGLYTAGASAGGPYTVSATSGGVSGTATVAVMIPNVGPSISAPAAANPSPVTGKTTALSVLGSDDAGESNLTYTWVTTGTPPASVAFSANGTNAAKNATATFSKAGSYTLRVTVTDQEGLTATSSVTVTVDQTLTSVTVSPASASVNTGANQQFSASAMDQFGAAMSTAPSFAWTTSGGGSIGSTGLFTAGSTAGGPYTVTATSGGTSGTGSVTVVSLPSTVYQINTGSSSAASPFTADQYVSGGTKRTVSNSITISGITNPAPTAVYQSERYGTSTYTLPNLTAGTQYTVRLHFAELYWTGTGKRKFNVVINGTTVLSSFDVYAAAGARYKAVLREFTTTANASGQIVINFNTVTDNATIEGIEIIRR